MTTDVEQRAIAQVFIKAKGASIPDGMLDDLLELEVDSSVHLPDMATLTFGDLDFEWSDAARLNIGDELVIELGSNDLRREVFAGEITGLELNNDMAGVAQLVVRAYDRGYRLHRGRQTRVFTKRSDSGIAADIAKEQGMTADVASTSPVHDYVLQDNRTDWEFLHDRAQRNGLELQVQGKKLVMKAPPSIPAEAVELTYGENLLSFRAQLTASEQVKEVEVRGWDPLRKQEIVASAKRGEVTTEVKDRSSGGETATRSFNDGAKVVIAREHVANLSQASALAQAALNELEQAFITAEGEAIGDPRLRLGSELKIQNAGQRFSGSYYVTAVTHSYGQDGYRNHFTISGRRPTDVLSLLSPPAGGGMQMLVGIVTNNKDDEGGDRGRVKVKLPTLGGNVESHWCRVVAPGAGAQRGVQFLPEVDDEVLVVGSDVNQLFVLGGLWNQNDQPPEVSSKNIKGGQVERRLIKSRTGHTLILDDSTSAPGITIVDSTGNNKIVIDTQSKGLTIEMDGDVSIKAKGSIQLKADRDISLEATGSLSFKSSTGGASIEAGTQLNLKANATATLQGGARTEVKAPNVAIGP